MIDTGDIYLADFGQEIRRRLVVSNGRFTAASGRAMVPPQYLGLVEQVTVPWRVSIEGTVFAVDLLRSVATEHLLDRTDRAPAAAMAAVRRAITQIT